MQSQSGELHEDAKRFMAGAFDFMGLGHGTCDEHHRESGRFGKIPVRGRNRRPSCGTGFEEYGEYQEPGMYEMEEAQRQPQTYREENWTQY